MNWLAIEAIGVAISAIISAYAIYQTVILHRQQMLLEKRQFLMPIWTKMNKLDEIVPDKPNWKDVAKAVNLLELIAVSWEGGLIDEDIIRRMYSQLYIEFYEKIIECKNPPQNVSKDGRQMLAASPAVTSLYQLLKAEAAARNRLTSIK